MPPTARISIPEPVVPAPEAPPVPAAAPGHEAAPAQGAAPPAPPGHASAPRGQDGALVLRAESIAGRTRLTEVIQRPPLATVRALYLDRALPEMAFSTVASSAGGVLQGDHLCIDVEVGPSARLHLGTQSATRIYRMPDAAASIDTRLAVAAGGYLEYLPDPLLPYAGARLETRTRCHVQGNGVLIVSETVAAGRVASGESLAFERVETLTEIGLDGTLIARDGLRLDPAEGLAEVGRLGRWSVVGSLFVISAGFDAGLLQAAIEPDRAGTLAGASALPGAAGAWLRVLADDPAGAAAVIRAAWTAARTCLIGAPPPADRRP